MSDEKKSWVSKWFFLKKNDDTPPKVLTADNTVQTKLTDFDPHMMTPKKQTTLEDWGALPPRPVRYTTGIQNWKGDDE